MESLPVPNSIDLNFTPKLNAALAKAQGMLNNATKDASNPFFSSTYATLASSFDACRMALSTNEIAVFQDVWSQGNDQRVNQVKIKTELRHSSGERIVSDVLTLPISPPFGPQQVGSALTYARRYQLQAIVGIAADDDDANSAQGALKNEMPKINSLIKKHDVKVNIGSAPEIIPNIYQFSDEDPATQSQWDNFENVDNFVDNVDKPKSLRDKLFELSKLKNKTPDEMKDIIFKVVGKNMPSSHLTDDELTKVINFLDKFTF